jgi:nitroimidazol reductase NimA-like FMN-containing flavoprotein (pyridoxamine 5'-phosphate oxidase superfamily)
MSTPLTQQELETVRQFLRAQSTLSLATVNAEGTPQIAPLFYVFD